MFVADLVVLLLDWLFGREDKLLAAYRDAWAKHSTAESADDALLLDALKQHSVPRAYHPELSGEVVEALSLWGRRVPPKVFERRIRAFRKAQRRGSSLR